MKKVLSCEHIHDDKLTRNAMELAENVLNLCDGCMMFVSTELYSSILKEAAQVVLREHMEMVTKNALSGQD